MKLLPLPAFSLLISPSNSSQLPETVIVTLSQLLLLRLLPNTAPRPQTVSQRDDDDLTPDTIEKCFLPFCANTSFTNDNAKVSILVENIFRSFLRHPEFSYKPTLDAAIEKGILARESKAKNDKRRRDDSARKQEDNDRMWLRASGERLRSLLAWVKRQNANDEGL
jgi:hypothetical protein